MHRVAVAARAGADDGSLHRSLRHIWFDHLREQDGDHVHVDPAYTGNEDSLHNATGQQYRQTTSFTYLGGTVTETPNVFDEINRRIRAGWMSFKRYKRELYDRPMASSLLSLKARMARSEVVEALLYGCATWTPLKGHYAKLRTTHHRMLLRILGAWCKSPNKRILSYKGALQRTECESIETTMRKRRLLRSGALLRMGDHR